ncbi:uncharacterized protein LOC126681932 [Mercurialis annua]|uniref:uncharacterized protein LOC126681932 n=1 Tax=Mercurialis annua TaxID=3986 RepID=UPI00215E04F8|nr:uncharacterized protein LOC126681932 [Mercurialis annua]
MFRVSLGTAYRIWYKGKKCLKNGWSVDFSIQYVEARRKATHQICFKKIVEVPFHCRTNIRSFVSSLNLSKSTVHRRVKQGCIKAHANTLKPTLTNENKKEMLKFCISMIDQGTVHSRLTFINMYNYVHIDEKWFYMTKISEKYYLHPQENRPSHACKSKKFIARVIFLGVVARPRVTSSGDLFTEKIGMILFIYQEHQDNAKPHISVHANKFVEKTCKNGFDIQLCFQSPQNPDLNILDLGFFNAIQSLQHKKCPRTIDELVTTVEEAFYEYPIENLNSV